MKITKEVLYEALSALSANIPDIVTNEDGVKECVKCPTYDNCDDTDGKRCFIRIFDDSILVAKAIITHRKEILK